MTKRNAGFALTTALVTATMFVSAEAGAATITLFNTGVDNSQAVLPDGTTGDLHYTLTPPGGTPVTLVRTSAGGYPIPPYLGDDTLSAWIGPANDNALNGPPGLYDYRTTFSLVGLDPSTASIIGQWSSDNAGIQILINGIDSNSPVNPYGGPPYSFQQWSPFAISSGFVAGLNTLDFIVQNGNGETDLAGPTAVRVEMTGDAVAVPGPIAGAGLPGLMLACGGLLGWWRQRKAVIS